MIHVIYAVVIAGLLAIVAALVAVAATYKSAVEDSNRQFAELETVARQAIDGWAAQQTRTREATQRMNATLDGIEKRLQA